MTQDEQIDRAFRAFALEQSLHVEDTVDAAFSDIQVVCVDPAMLDAIIEQAQVEYVNQLYRGVEPWTLTERSANVTGKIYLETSDIHVYVCVEEGKEGKADGHYSLCHVVDIEQVPRLALTNRLACTLEERVLADARDALDFFDFCNARSARTILMEDSMYLDA